MCGIVGVLNLTERPAPDRDVVLSMLGMLQHRGPDGYGVYRDEWVGLGSARLSIIDLAGGDQPISNEDGSLWIVYNGEIFNYVELRPQLEALGHHFATQSDTEVIVHLYEEYGPACLRYLNGQFALALWDATAQRLFLARDRLGIRPLFYTLSAGRLIFASEVKALLAYPGVRAGLDPRAVEQIFTYWSTLTPATVFEGVREVPPGSYMLAERGDLRIEPYWRPDFTPEDGRPETDYVAELESLLIDAARLRMRADVPVGAYLSGGLDSSLTTAIVRDYTDSRLETFSIAFENPDFDESVFQYRMADYLGTQHHVVHCSDADVGRVFPDVIWHTETPILRTAPAPLFMLSELVHDHGLKVVVTGEGADEVLAGYDIFKEMAIRRFWARVPDSEIRPLLLQRLYPDISGLSRSGGAYLNAFFRRDLETTDSPYYSHAYALRWSNTGRNRRFLSTTLAGDAAQPWAADLTLPENFSDWPALGQAQYLEMTIFLSQYLLSSQGDRVAMAHSVEGRYPFLDFRVVEFCNRLPPGVKLRGLMEKWLLRRVASKHLPEEIWRRPKRPYRAPIHAGFFGARAPDYVAELLSPRAIAESGIFVPATVEQLTRKAASGRSLSEVEDMALAGILSTQLVYQKFVSDYQPGAPVTHARLKIVDRTQEASERT